MRPDIDPPPRSATSNDAGRPTPELIANAWRSSRNGAEFREMLDRAGLPLAAGDRRDFVIIDRDGTVRSLARVLRAGGIDASAADIRSRLADIASSLPDPDDARRRHSSSGDTQDRPKRERGPSATRSREMPRRDEAEAARKERWKQAQQRRRAEERAARDEIHARAEAQVRAQHASHRQESNARNRAQGKEAWRQEQDLRSDEWNRLRSSQQRERGAIYRGTQRGLIRTLSLAFHRHLSKVARNRLKSTQAKRWSEAKASSPKAMPMTFREFLQSRAPIDDLARWLLDRRRQRDDHRRAHEARHEKQGRSRQHGLNNDAHDNDRDPGLSR